MSARKQKPMGFIELGEYFGYPPCCIADFIEYVLVYQKGQAPIRGQRKLTGTGYVPCPKCNEKSVAELLSYIAANRQHPKPFPNQD